MASLAIWMVAYSVVAFFGESACVPRVESWWGTINVCTAKMKIR